jgi:hypothetical protein
MPIRLIWLLVFVGALLPFPVPSQGDEVVFSRTFDLPHVARPGEELVVAGTVNAAAPVVLVIRIDDGSSTSYASRANIERTLPPGPFRLRVPLAGQRSPRGRTIDAADIRKIVVFAPTTRSGAIRAQAHIDPPVPLPDGAVGWDFGPPSGAVYPGFEAITAGDGRIHGRAPRALARPGGDPLIADGVGGVERFSVSLPNGRWRITLWTGDLGEWETLPWYIERRIRVNGKTVEHERLAPRQWIAGRYLEGRNREALADGDPWRVIGKRRGRRMTVETKVRNNRLVIDLAGDRHAATHLAAVLAEPVGGRAVEFIEADRAERFRQTWRLMPGDPHLRPPDLQLETPAPRTATPGSLAIIDLTALAPWNDAHPVLSVVAPRSVERSLPMETRFGYWRYDRRDPASTLLVANSDHLRGDIRAMRLIANLPRAINLVIRVPATTPPGRYEGSVRLTSRGASVEAPIILEVLATSLPAPDRKIGVYLEPAPHLEWFPELAAARKSARWCDLVTLRRFGLTVLSPPLATPSDAGLGAFLGDLERYVDAGFSVPPLSYTSVKRLPRASLAATLEWAMEAVRERGLPMPIWSVADEPGNPGGDRSAAAALARQLQNAIPDATVAGHLNHPADALLLPHLDVALINAGFGVDSSDVARVRRTATEPWFYNMARPRLAAGFYLWRSGAAGYLQWHARMPTADPYDPTDGREGDVQLLYPQDEICPITPDVHRDLLEMAEGIQDLRWLSWLEMRARRNDRARRVLADLRRVVPGTWEAARRIDPDCLDVWRSHITELAR